MTVCVTTSWDDGHPLDLRVAEMLARYGIPGTFYAPRNNSRATLDPNDLRRLSQHFEIGAHTLNHIDLLEVTQEVARQEIFDSKQWIEDVTGKPCACFCFPKGHFRPAHLQYVQMAGFAGARTVELLSTAWPKLVGGTWLMPTTLQAHPHKFFVYARNLAKRKAWRNLPHLAFTVKGGDWLKSLEQFAADMHRHGGILHLWGHAWEIEERQQWDILDRALAVLASLESSTKRLTNAEIFALTTVQS